MLRNQEFSVSQSFNSSLPFTVAEIKTYLRVTGSSEDSLISDIIFSACRYVENYCSVMLLPGTVTEKYTKLPGTVSVPGASYISTPGAFFWMNYYPYGFYSLSVGNVTAITSIEANTYDAPTSWTALVNTSVLDAGHNRPRLYAPKGWDFGSITPYQIKIVYTAGYADTASIPPDMKMAIRLIIADMYENRMDSVRQLPTASEILLQNYCVMQGV